MKEISLVVFLVEITEIHRFVTYIFITDIVAIHSTAR